MATSAESSEIEATRTPEEVVRDAFAAIGRRDIEALGPHYAEDVVEDVAPVGVLRGRAAVVAFFDEVFKAVPDLEMTVGRVVTDGGERVVAEWRLSGTFSGAQYLGIDPTGKHIELRGMDMFEVRGGEIVTNTAFYDGADFARQIGMMPAQDSAAEKALKSAFNAVTKVRRAVGEKVGG